MQFCKSYSNSTENIAQSVNKFPAIYGIRGFITMNNTVIGIMTLCSSAEVKRLFGVKHRLHFQGRILSQARKRQETFRKLLHASLLLRLFFDPKDGGGMFVRNGKIFHHLLVTCFLPGLLFDSEDGGNTCFRSGKIFLSAYYLFLAWLTL
jgi:hypothetical protein